VRIPTLLANREQGRPTHTFWGVTAAVGAGTHAEPRHEVGGGAPRGPGPPENPSAETARPHEKNPLAPRVQPVRRPLCCHVR
jgi:hypothetical protein